MAERRVTTISLPVSDYEWIKKNYPLSTVSRIVVHMVEVYISNYEDSENS